MGSQTKTSHSWFELATQTPAQSQTQPITGSLYTEGPRRSPWMSLCVRLFSVTCPPHRTKQRQQKTMTKWGWNQKKLFSNLFHDSCVLVLRSILPPHCLIWPSLGILSKVTIPPYCVLPFLIWGSWSVICINIYVCVYANMHMYVCKWIRKPLYFLIFLFSNSFSLTYLG